MRAARAKSMSRLSWASEWFVFIRLPMETLLQLLEVPECPVLQAAQRAILEQSCKPDDGQRATRTEISYNAANSARDQNSDYYDYYDYEY